MVTPEVKTWIRAIAGATAIGLMHTTTAQATIFNFAFRVTVDQGSYQGVHTGTFRFDTTRMMDCPNSPRYKCATPTASNLSLIFNFMGTTYTQASDVDFANATAQFPAVYYLPEREAVPLESRSLFSPYILSLIVMPPQTNQSFAILGDSFYTGFNAVHEADKVPVTGRVSYFQLPNSNPAPAPPPPSPCQLNPDSCEGSAAVPEPSEIAGTAIAVGVFGLFWRLRRQKGAFKP
jgi:hypothetical protein